MLFILAVTVWWLYPEEPKEPPPSGIMYYAGYSDPWDCKHKYPGWVLDNVEPTDELYDDDCGLTVYYRKLTYVRI